MDRTILKGTWVDYTRRNDPACPQGLEIFKNRLGTSARLPHVLCFWTKNPEGLAALYWNIIKELKDAGTTVLAYVTINNYGNPLESGVPEPKMEELLKLLGPDNIRIRFDPIVIGYTNRSHYINGALKFAAECGIKEIVVNFMMPYYKNVAKVLTMMSIPAINPNRENMLNILNVMHEITPKDIKLKACAETQLILGDEMPPWLGHASCADANWAYRVNPEIRGLKGNSSRPGCGCTYSNDWGIYRNSQGGYKCPHSCLYCYAK